MSKLKEVNFVYYFVYHLFSFFLVLVYSLSLFIVLAKKMI